MVLHTHANSVRCLLQVYEITCLLIQDVINTVIQLLPTNQHLMVLHTRANSVRLSITGI